MYRCCCGNFVDRFTTGLFSCSRCGATHLDADRFAKKLHTRHVCFVYNYHWIKQPAVVGNPLAALGCSLDGGVLYVSRVLVTGGEPHVVSGLT